MVDFVNIFSANVTQQYQNCILAAEQFISAHWIDPVTINLSFDAAASGTDQPQTSFVGGELIGVSYATFRNALVAHANNPDAQAAVATLPVSDPTAAYAGNHLWSLSRPYAKMLGLTVLNDNDGQITLNTSYAWSYGLDVTDVLERDITEFAMGRQGRLGDVSPSGTWSAMDLFRYSSAHFRDFTDGRDGVTTYFSVDGNALLLPFNNRYAGSGNLLGGGDVGNFNALDVFGFVQPGNKGVLFSATDYTMMNVLGWTPAAFTPGPLTVSASGDFDGDGSPDVVWRRSSDSHMGMWSYNAATLLVTPTDLGTVSLDWAVLGSAQFASSPAHTQMLMDHVPTGTMTLWWVANGQLTGIDLGQKWNNVGYVATGGFGNGGPTVTDFLVSGTADHHLYDWWIDTNNTLQGVDLGPNWSNVGLVATGAFTNNIGLRNSLLVSNSLDHHLYDWWIGSNNTLQGIDLGPVWSNVSFVAAGRFTANGNSNFLVSNSLDHHLYDWWIGSNNTLQGLDLGAVWSNVALVATGAFDNNSAGATEVLVQNTVDHHLYEWWITSQNQLAGIDLGPYWSNVQLIGDNQYNSSFNQLLVRNTSDSHFYQWWIANNQLQGIDLGPVGDAPMAATGNPSSSIAASTPALATSAGISSSGAVSPAPLTSMAAPAALAPSTTASPALDGTASPAPSAPLVSPDSTSLLVQAMASFGPSDALAHSSAALLGTAPVQQPELASASDPRFVHGA